MSSPPARSAPSPDAPPPPEAELELLSCLQRLEEASAADLRHALRPLRELSHASVSTLLQRLQERGLVARRKADVGKTYLYRPTDEAGATFQQAADRLLHRVFGGDRVGFVASLLGSRRPDRDELEQLRALVERQLEEVDR